MENAQILASVNEKAITTADVTEFIAGMGPGGAQYDTPDGRKSVLEELIARALFLADAQKNLYEFDPAFKAELAKVKESMLSGFAIEKVLSNVRVSDNDLEKFYEENKDALGGGETVRASHILVETEDQAKAVKAEIESGKISFEDAARKYSSCPSKEEGGSLGEFSHGQMVKEFDDACFSMEVGAISDPVQTQFGFHLIRLDAKNPARVPTLDEAREQLSAALLRKKQAEAYQSKVNQLKIVYPVERF